MKTTGFLLWTLVFNKFSKVFHFFANFRPVCRVFSDKLDFALKEEKTLYHKALSRSERKELTLLSMILIPKDWTIENRGMSLIVRPPEEAEKVRVELERRQKLDTSRRLARR